MWFVCDVLYAALCVRVSCFVVHGCAWMCMDVHGCAWMCMDVLSRGGI